MKIVLVRDPKPDCTPGKLTVGALQICTLEEAWRPDPDGPGGQRREGSLIESCVPDGEYQVVPHDSPRFPLTYALVAPQLGVYRWPQDMPEGQKYGRSAILIHSGNTIDDIMGCIAVGLQHGKLGLKPAVLYSRAGLDQLRNVLRRDTHTLTIHSIPGSLVTQ